MPRHLPHGIASALLLVLLAPVASGSHSIAHATADAPPGGATLHLHGFPSTGDYVVGFAPHVGRAAAENAARERGLIPLRWIEPLHALVVHPAPSVGSDGAATDVEARLHGMAARPDVRYVEADAIARPQLSPDDPRYDAHQWAPQRIGAPEAWDTTTGSSDVIVAVLDSGLDMAHEDLVGRWVPGTDIFNGDTDPSDDFGHGTWVSGVVSAGLDNGVGIASIGGATRVMPIKVTDDTGSTSYSRIASGVAWAVDNGADILNISLGGTADLQILEDAMRNAHDAGVLVVAAAGNGNSSTRLYPAAYETVLAVAATTETDARWPSSNYGDWLSIAAPGSAIDTTNWTGNGAGTYVTAGGTSVATPHVAGVAALVLAACPDLTRDGLVDRLQSTALDLGDPGFDPYFGHGRVDAAAAVAGCAPPTPAPETDIFMSVARSGSVSGIAFDDEDILRFEPGNATWSLLFDGSDVGLSSTDVTGIAFVDGGIWMSFGSPAVLPGVGTVDDSDIVRFDPTSLGDTTAGTFGWVLDGSDVGLSKNGEDLDAIGLLPDGRVLLSTTGSVDLPSLSADDEDLLVFTFTRMGERTEGTWDLYFDGSDVDLDGKREDVNAVWSDAASGDLYLSTMGAFSVPGSHGTAADVFVAHPQSLGPDTSCTFGPGLYWSGALWGFGAEDIDALEIAVAP